MAGLRILHNGLGDRTSQYVYLTRPGTTALSGTINYYYDGLRMLKKVKNPAGFNNGDSLRYVYDKAGNRMYKYRGANGTDQINGYRQSDNELTSRDKLPYMPEPYYYEYDANGNQTQSVEDISRTYAYDYENRLIKVKSGSDSTVFYYNGDGFRLKKVCTGDTSTQYIPDGMYSAVERTNGGRLRYKYVYANGLLLARTDSSNNTYYYHHDGLGSVIGMSSNAIAVSKSYLYDEFGDSLGAWGSTPYNTYKYTGQEYDGKPVYAYNLRAREYYPKLGRFMQNDPIGDAGGSINWYLYVGNNPINYVDITGLECCYDCGTRLAAFASKAAISSGLGGIHNGVQDAFRHCFWSCWMAIQCGLPCAEAVGFGHEIDNVFNDHEPYSEFNMDMYNNAAGRICSRTNNCYSCCMERALQGRLKVLTTTKK